MADFDVTVITLRIPVAISRAQEGHSQAWPGVSLQNAVRHAAVKHLEGQNIAVGPVQIETKEGQEVTCAV